MRELILKSQLLLLLLKLELKLHLLLVQIISLQFLAQILIEQEVILLLKLKLLRIQSRSRSRHGRHFIHHLLVSATLRWKALFLHALLLDLLLGKRLPCKDIRESSIEPKQVLRVLKGGLLVFLALLLVHVLHIVDIFVVSLFLKLSEV